ncbi:MAG: hypothetical protein CM15mP104_0740 [Gammaproteobacteria bacterium]|nr:MAG: hypothetical protein CM15mP104_0740 [Gammaproteobacteria bacterium]
MMQKVREAERENIVSKFRHQNNTLINGVVKRVTRDNVIVEIIQTLKLFSQEINCYLVKFIKLTTESEQFTN